MSITATITDKWSDGKRQHVIGTLAFSGNYTTGGVAVDFAEAGVAALEPPVRVDIPAWRGYMFDYIPGTLATNGLVRVRAGTAGAVAFSTLTSSTVAVTPGGTVTLGGQVYTFRAALTASTTANEVLAGADAAASLTNLKAAINADSAGAGTLFGSLTAANTYCIATTLTASTLLVVNKIGGTIGNATTTTSTEVTLTWTSTVLASGVDAISTGLERTGAPTAFATDLTATETAVPFYAIFQQLM